MAKKTQPKSAKRNATKPARVAVAPGTKKLSPRKSAKAARKGSPRKAAKKVVAKKTVKKLPASKRPAKKTAVKKSVRKAPAKKAVKKAAKKAAPKAAKKAPAKKTAAKPPAKTSVRKAAAAKPAKVQRAEPAPKAERVKAVREAAAQAAPPAAPASRQAPPAPVQTAAAAQAQRPRKRGRKRRDPLEDLLRPEKRRGRPGRPRKRGGLAELMPKRPRLRKRARGKRGEEDMDLPVAPRPPAPRDTMSLEEIRADVLERYLRGETPPCPVGCGGMAQVVRVSTTETGAGEIWLECLSCAQRERFEVPAPTVEERNSVFATLEAGNEPVCPRHDRWIPLRRRGRDLVCPECGILVQGR